MRHELAAAADAAVAPTLIGFCDADRVAPQILATPIAAVAGAAAGAGATAGAVGVTLGVVGATVAGGGLAVGLVKGDEEEPASPPEASATANGDVRSLLSTRSVAMSG